MDKKFRVVLDTNVLVSATFNKISPLPQKIYQALKAQQFILVTSVEIIEELEDVISRDYVIARNSLSVKDRKSFIGVLVNISMFTSGRTLLQKVSRDKKDDKFLACAFEAKADYLVTGDKDLLVLKEFQGTNIIKPRDFIKILKEIK